MIPVAVEKCIKCLERRPGATPWLCLSCVRDVVKEMMRNELFKYATEEQQFAAIKRRLNQVQRGARNAFKRHGEQADGKNNQP